MFKRILKSVGFVLASYLLVACTSTDYLSVASITTEAVAADTYMVGETPVKIVTTRFGGGGHTFVALHENESTSVSAAKKVLRTKGGVLVELKHGGGRDLSFRYKGKTYTVDPNRIFTDAGIRKTLGASYSTEAHEVVNGLAHAILSRLSRSAIVSLHNNTNGSYSIKSYEPGKQYARDVSVPPHIVPGHDTDDFFFVTSSRIFGVLKSKGFNVALQSSSGTDDGSLSVYCVQRGIPYVNVEAQKGHLSQQIEMIEALF
ncbi:protein tyrosine phosphatase [Candidatus Kaiserbacteria bacterium CG10_big_fil_rev_8_21_14_0_10_44_10]|uniref:Protein tyrosine phosphatase n=1 Tax=Candidatus Kaiserbacteria bacterium CG10_big_fil_rev_8_21_14_0_10_44_10 TaxID=1974606 RepID=A0A2H0UI79_9BACT|nr:MAG: protein tyrosine phosphatase [Candidatus Kaiserbacteria bacterium CG10_big_fil_rev_8_21_14_0_10_44_10]